MLAPMRERHTHETNETSRGAWAEVVMAARQGARRRAPVAAGVGSRSQARETGHEKNMEDAKSRLAAISQQRDRREDRRRINMKKKSSSSTNTRKRRAATDQEPTG